MTKTIRFGTKAAAPPIAQIKQELRLMAASNELIETGFFDARRPPSTQAGRHDLASELSRKHGLSIDRAQMLVERFESSRHTLSPAHGERSAARPLHDGASWGAL